MGIGDNTNYYDEIASIMAQEIEKVTPQLYLNDNSDSKSKPIGDSSSILLRIKHRSFLITTGHTFIDIDPSSIGIMIGNYFYSIGGTLKYFEPNDREYYDPKKLDLTIFDLADETVEWISKAYDFLDYRKLSIVHDNTECPYIIFGYPERKTKMKNSEKIINPTPFLFRTIGASANAYLHKEIDPAKTLIVNARQKKVMRPTTGLMEKLPKLNGISGCGVWGVYNLGTDDLDYKLVSILTGENKEKTFLYSTKVNLLIELLIQHFNVECK